LSSTSAEPIYRDVLDPNNPARRQELIKQIQEVLGGKLITYTASPFHQFALIMKQDALLIEDLLRSASDASTGFLMLTSPGGDPNAAEKLLMMCRERFRERFKIIVPDYAKSAATLLALGSDEILMGYLAELGPIDPQISTASLPMGPLLPARAFIDGLENIRARITRDGDPPVMYVPMLSQIRPEVLAMCQSAIDESRATAEKWLKRYMLKDDPQQAERVATWLSDGKTYRPHGKVINFEEAHDVLKLNATKLDRTTTIWDKIWELYVRSIHFAQQSGVAKMFESEKVSLNMQIEVQIKTMPRPSPPTQEPPKPAPGPTRMYGPQTKDLGTRG